MPLLKELLEVVLQVVGRHLALRVVCHRLLAEVVEGEGSGGRQAAVAGLIEDKPHKLQGDLGLALVLVHPGGSSPSFAGRIISAQDAAMVNFWRFDTSRWPQHGPNNAPGERARRGDTPWVGWDPTTSPVPCADTPSG